MEFRELSQNKVGVIHSVVNGSPSFFGGWLKFFPVGSEILFDNPILSSKIVVGGVWTSGGSVWAYETVRRDGGVLDIDRYLLSESGSGILVGKTIIKNFVEHHSQKLPIYYN